MDGKYITVEQILEARDRRVAQQQALLCRYRQTLICFTMNIAGPQKCNAQIREGFFLGIRMLIDTLKTASVPLLHQDQEVADTGCTAFFVVQGNSSAIKQLCVGLEDSIPVGRLFDMDVISADGNHISRESLDLPPRSCLICDGPAKLCSRSRTHSVEALQKKTATLLQQALDTRFARTVAALAQKSLLHEVCTTPKPGLVDCANTGSHTDMDIFTFMSSTAALNSYFHDCTLAGIRTKGLPPKSTFTHLRALGRIAEQEMFRATDGVNTHKGAIFTLGLLCGAAGRLGDPHCRQPQQATTECAAMVAGLLQNDFAHQPAPDACTAGQRLYAQYGITGIRGQAAAGFPAVIEAGLPTLESGLAQGKSLNDAGCAALLALLASTDDTNLIARSDRNTQLQVQALVAALLKENPYPDAEILRQLDRRFTQENLSCGGSADLLAATYFLYFLQNQS